MPTILADFTPSQSQNTSAPSSCKSLEKLTHELGHKVDRMTAILNVPLKEDVKLLWKLTSDTE